MNIKPSAAIRQNYNEIARLCRESHEPIYLTRNGEGDLVVMDIESFTIREKMLLLREELLKSEEDVANGVRCYSLNETNLILNQTIDRVAENSAAYNADE
jgi:PHD/YefM family antitoxin component YafN of YafNO toxin-antitoxin module